MNMTYYQEYDPPTHLEHFVECFWVLYSDDRLANKWFRVFPSFHVECILAANEFYVKPAQKRSSTLKFQNLITGARTDTVQIRSAGIIDWVGVRFKPAIVQVLPDLDGSLLANTNYTTKLGLNVTDHVGFDLRLSHLSNQLTILSKELVVHQHLIQLNQLTEYIQAHKGNVQVKELAAHFNCSSKTVERLFNKTLGISPKGYIRMVRFWNILKYKQLNPDHTSVECAYAMGFYDENHFYKELNKIVPKYTKELLNKEFEKLNHLHQVRMQG